MTRSNVDDLFTSSGAGLIGEPATDPPVHTLKDPHIKKFRGEPPQSHRVPGFLSLGNRHDARPTATQRTSLWPELSTEFFPHIYHLLSFNKDKDYAQITKTMLAILTDNDRPPAEVVFLFLCIKHSDQKIIAQDREKIDQLIHTQNNAEIQKRLSKCLHPLWMELCAAVDRGNTALFLQIVYALTGEKLQTFEEARDVLNYAVRRVRTERQVDEVPEQAAKHNSARRKTFAERYASGK